MSNDIQTRKMSVGAHLPVVPRNIGDCCPITLEPINELADACLAEDRYVYNRTALMAALASKGTNVSPMTSLPMPRTTDELFAQNGLRHSFPLSSGQIFDRMGGFTIGWIGGVFYGILSGTYLQAGKIDSQTADLTAAIMGLSGGIVGLATVAYIYRRQDRLDPIW